MTFDYNDVVILNRVYDTLSKDFVGRIIGRSGSVERLKLKPLSVEHELYITYHREYIESNCGFLYRPIRK